LPSRLRQGFGGHAAYFFLVTANLLLITDYWPLTLSLPRPCPLLYLGEDQINQIGKQ